MNNNVYETRYEALAMAVIRQAAKDLSLKLQGKKYTGTDPERFLSGKYPNPVISHYPELGSDIAAKMSTLSKEELSRIA